MNKVCLCLFIIIFFSCKKENVINQIDEKIVKHTETNKTEQNSNYYEAVKIKKTANYNFENEIQKLDIGYNSLNLEIRYIEEKAYLSMKNEDILILDWHPFLINISYDTTIEDTENDIHLLLNDKNTSKGYLVFPAYTEEFPSYFVYCFQKDKLDYIGNFNHINFKKGTLSFNEKMKELHILSDKKYTLNKLEESEAITEFSSDEVNKDIIKIKEVDYKNFP